MFLEAIMELRDRICMYMSRIPPAVAGQHGHDQTFAAACALYNGFALDEDQLWEFMSLYNSRCVPPWEEKDLRHKVEEAIKAQHTKPRGHLIGGNGTFKPEDFKYRSFPAAKPKETKPTIDPATVVEKFLKGYRCSDADIYDASPIKPADDFRMDAAMLVYHLFRPGELINFVTAYKMSANKDGVEKCVPGGVGEFAEHSDLAEMWELTGPPTSDAGGWMRINPMDGKGVGDASVTNFRHILLEFDSIPFDLQLSFFAKLPLPISCILTSGGKSLHAWVRCDCLDLTSYKDAATMLFKILAPYGVDTQNKNPSRLSRLVGATRKIGATGDGRQRLLYLNPKPEQKAIL